MKLTELPQQVQDIIGNQVTLNGNVGRADIQRFGSFDNADGSLGYYKKLSVLTQSNGKQTWGMTTSFDEVAKAIEDSGLFTPGTEVSINGVYVYNEEMGKVEITAYKVTHVESGETFERKVAESDEAVVDVLNMDFGRREQPAKAKAKTTKTKASKGPLF